MAVNIKGCAGVGMTEPPGYRANIYAGTDRQSGGGVSEAMQRNQRQLRGRFLAVGVIIIDYAVKSLIRRFQRKRSTK